MANGLDDVFAGLSTNPHLASFGLLQRVKTQFLAKTPGEVEYAAACGVLEAFYDVDGWKVPSQLVPGGYANEVEEVVARARAGTRLQFEGFQNQIMANYRAVMKAKASEALKGSLANSVGYAVLDGEEKKEVHDHIAKIRVIIQESKLADRKKNNLFDRLSELSAEVDRNGTRTDRFFAFAQCAALHRA
jgi:hypothetical protein